MPETFYGDWSLEVLYDGGGGHLIHRLRISGSDSTDGVYNPTKGTTIARVTGQPWVLTVESLIDAGSSLWLQSRNVKRTASYDVQDGLVIVLHVFDGVQFPKDDYFSYYYLTMRCKSLNPEMDPPASGNPYDFTVPANMIG